MGDAAGTQDDEDAEGVVPCPVVVRGINLLAGIKPTLSDGSFVVPGSLRQHACRMVDAENASLRCHCCQGFDGAARSNAEIKDCVVGTYFQRADRDRIGFAIYHSH